MSRSMTTVRAGRVHMTAFALRNWKSMLLVVLVIMPVVWTWRFFTGRRMIGGGRSTDATFFSRAREERRGWWADKPGYFRAAVRCCGVAVLWLWFIAPVAVYVLVSVELVVGACWAVRKYREMMHERHVLRPVWPAVAGIIGVPDTQPPSRWLDIPYDHHNNPTTPDTEPEIVVGLRAADADDERRVRDLVTLFDQRFGRRHHGTVDYAARRVHIRVRPDEPHCWPAVANILGLDSGELAEDWLVVPADYDTPGARIHVRMPADVVNQDPIREELKRAINQQFPGEWSAATKPPVWNAKTGAHEPARVELTHKHPTPVPPTYVDFLAEHPSHQKVN